MFSFGAHTHRQMPFSYHAPDPVELDAITSRMTAFFDARLDSTATQIRSINVAMDTATAPLQEKIECFASQGIRTGTLMRWRCCLPFRSIGGPRDLHMRLDKIQESARTQRKRVYGKEYDNALVKLRCEHDCRYIRLSPSEQDHGKLIGTFLAPLFRQYRQDIRARL